MAIKSQTNEAFIVLTSLSDSYHNNLHLIWLQRYFTENVCLEQYSTGAHSNHRISPLPNKDAALLHPSYSSLIKD